MAFQPSMLSGKPRIAHGHELRRFHDDPAGGDDAWEPVPQRRPARRDHRGNLIGGEQNESIQRYNLEETLADKEHKRWLAHRDAALHATFPTSFALNGVEIPVAKMAELETLSHKRLRQRALDLRDLLESSRSNFFGHNQHLRLNANAHAEALAQWIVDVQVVVASAVGYDDLDHAAFGAQAPQTPARPIRREAPASFPWSQYGDQAATQDPRAHAFANAPPASFPWSQYGVADNANQDPRAHAAAANVAPASFPWSQHGVAAVTEEHERVPARTPVGAWRQQPAQHQGFSLVPPHLASGGGSRFDDGQRIARRGHGSAVSLG